MLGFLLGALVGLSYVGIGVDAELMQAAWVYAGAIGVVLVGAAIGMFMPRTVGVAAVSGFLGAVIGAVIALFEDPVVAGGLLLNAAAFVIVQHGMKARLSAAALQHAVRPTRPADTPTVRRFVKRFDLGQEVYADFYLEGTRLSYVPSPALAAAQPPLELFYSMEIDKEYQRLTEQLTAAADASRSVSSDPPGAPSV